MKNCQILQKLPPPSVETREQIFLLLVRDKQNKNFAIFKNLTSFDGFYFKQDHRFMN